MPEYICQRPSPFRLFCIEDIHPYMFINKQGVPGSEHEQGGVQV